MNTIPTDQLLATELQNIRKRFLKINQGFSSGYANLDTDLMGGFQEGCLYCLGSVAGMGKTMFTLNLVVNQLQNLATNEVLVFLSTGTSSPVLIQKLLATATGIELRKIQGSDLSKEELEILQNHPFLTLLKSNNLVIIEQNKPNINEIEDALKFLVVEDKIPRMIYIDCIQDLQLVAENINREHSLFKIMNKLKLMAAQFRIPILLTSKVNRHAFYRKDGQVPKLDDLLDSRYIAEVADYIYMLHRPNYYGISTIPLFSNSAEELNLYGRKNKHLPLDVLVMGAYLKKQQIMEEPVHKQSQINSMNLHKE